MKNQWPFWLFIVGVIIVVIFSLNYQQRNQVISLGDIFPEENEDVLDYEYVVPKESIEVSKKETVEPVAVTQKAVSKEKRVSKPVEPVVPKAAPVVTQKTPVKKPVPVKKPEVVSSGTYAIQVLSSTDKQAAEKALGKVKQNGFKDAFIRDKDLGDRGTWYRIYTAYYETIGKAKEALLTVKKTYPDAYILKL